MGRLLCEAVAAGKDLEADSEWLCPDEVLQEIAEEGASLNAEVLNDEEFQRLRAQAEAYWLEHGRPVDPPLKPEAISKNHHNPYLVNYKHEPLPLRVGELTLSDEQITGDLTDCGAERVFDRDELGRFQRKESVERQRDGIEGDMAFVFSTDEFETDEIEPQQHPGQRATPARPSSRLTRANKSKSG